MRSSLLSSLASFAVASLLGCGGSAQPPPESNIIEQGDAMPLPDASADSQVRADADVDAGIDAPVFPYPAYTPDIGLLLNNGGAILSAPKIVTVTWASDTNGPAFEKFGDLLGASSYWQTAVSEYGVGPSTSGAANHVIITTAPPSPWDDVAFENWVIAQVNDIATSKWPAADAQTIYSIFVPANVSFTSGGADACNSYSGYHTEVTVGANTHVLYAVTVEACNGSATVLDAATETAAHEMGEAATDPHAYSDLGLVGFDKGHLAWELFQARQDENGDACEFYNEAYYKEGADLPFAVQRLWSNAHAAAGHNPCIPVPAGAYYNVTPMSMEDIMVFVGGGTTQRKTKGYRIGVGQSRTFEAGFYSDAPSAPWTLGALEGDGYTAPVTPHLTITTDKPLGNNGDKAKVTVTVNTAPAQGTEVLMTMVSTLNTNSHYMPVLIGTY